MSAVDATGTKRRSPGDEPPLTPSGGPPTSADLRTAVNQIQSLLLLLDSSADLTTPTSTSGEEGLLSAATPSGGTLASLLPQADEKEQDDEVASDSSDAPLMQQQSQPSNKKIKTKQNSLQSLAALASQPGLAQMLPALLLPLQPATPMSIAQLNMSSVAMGFPNTSARYRGAVQHAFNLIGDLQRGIQMLSNPMPDAGNPGRKREAALTVAGRLMRHTSGEVLQERIERIRKRQKMAAQVAEDSKSPKEAMEENRVEAMTEAPGTKLEPQILQSLDEEEHGSLDAYITSLEAKINAQTHRARVRLRCHSQRVVQLVLSQQTTVYISHTQSRGSAVITRVVALSAAEQAELQALEQSNGLSSLAIHPSRFPIFQAISQHILARSVSHVGQAGRSRPSSWERIGATVLTALREADALGGGSGPAHKHVQEGGLKRNGGS